MVIGRLNIGLRIFSFICKTKTLGKMKIREEIKSKLFYFYPDFFSDLERSLNNLGELDFYLWMNSTQSIINESLHDDKKSAKSSQNLEFNGLLLTQEIFDDFGAALTCFTVGYFKQTQSLLRNSVELTFQLWKNKSESEFGIKPSNPWIEGNRGIEKIDDTSKQIEMLDNTIPGIKLKIRRLRKLYGILCMSTHSHKKRMNSINVPHHHSTLNALCFEPLEFLYTKRIYVYTLYQVLELLICYFANQIETDWKLPIVETFEDEIKNLRKSYHLQIFNFEKGFLIYRESLKITEEKIAHVYSIDLNKNLKELTKKKIRLNEIERKLFNKAIIERIQNGK